jgi:RecA-family ATPase
MPFAGEDAVLASPEGRTNIVKATPLLKIVEAVIEKIAPTLMVLDTLADLFSGDENQRAQARQFIGLLRGLAMRHRCTIVLLAHPSLTGISSGRGTSGSTAWSNSVRSQLYLQRHFVLDGMERLEPDEALRELVVKKANYAAKGAPIRLKWVEGTFERQASAFGLDTADRDTTAELVFMKLLRLTEAQGIRVNAKSSASYAPSVFAKRNDANGITKRAFQGAMERLLNQGKIRLEHDGPPSRRVSYLTAYVPDVEGE